MYMYGDLIFGNVHVSYGLIYGNLYQSIKTMRFIIISTYKKRQYRIRKDFEGTVYLCTYIELDF